MSDNDVGQYKEPTPAPSFKDSNGEPLTGRAQRESFLGYHQTPSEPEPETYGPGDDELRRAARDLGRERRERGDAGDELVERKQHKPDNAEPGTKFSTTAREAARQLSQDRAFEDNLNAAENLMNLQRETDNAKIVLSAVNRGEITAEEARIVEARANEEAATGVPYQPEQQPQAEQPQPDESVEQPAPSGLSPKVAAALQDPEIRSALEQAIAPAEQARATYLHATQELADVTTAAVLASWPELSGLTAQTLPVALAAIARENPEKAAAIKSHIDQATIIHQANQHARAQQHQAQQQQLAQWAARENQAFEKMISAEATPERRALVKSEFESFAKENNLTHQQIATIFSQNPVLQSAAFGRLVWDALSHRAAKRSAMSNPASRNAVPTVQRPGAARTRSEIAESELGDLKSEFKKAKGNEQLRLAVKLHQAQRRARG
jgi:hypothetical protein